MAKNVCCTHDTRCLRPPSLCPPLSSWPLGIFSTMYTSWHPTLPANIQTDTIMQHKNSMQKLSKMHVKLLCGRCEKLYTSSVSPGLIHWKACSKAKIQSRVISPQNIKLMHYEWSILKIKNKDLYVDCSVFTKFPVSLNKVSWANGKHSEQIFACDCKNSGETEEVQKGKLLKI